MISEGSLVARIIAKGDKPSKAVIQIDKLLPLLSKDDIKKLLHRMTFDQLADPATSPERRRELLSGMDRCPCCERWLGHNRPPADEGDPP
jgi:hypothetical protein